MLESANFGGYNVMCWSIGHAANFKWSEKSI